MKYTLQLAFFVVAFGICGAAVYTSKDGKGSCHYPTYKCDCKLYYNCDTINTGFPDDDLGASNSGVLKDLAPGDYPMQIPGKRWRRHTYSQRRYCERECYRRLNAFLCLDDGDDTVYSRLAVCTKLQQGGAVAFDSTTNEPCCQIFLQWGPQWCEDKWYKSVFAVTCEGEVDSSFPGNTVLVTASSCAVGSSSGGTDTWCSGTAPTCTI